MSSNDVVLEELLLEIAPRFSAGAPEVRRLTAGLINETFSVKWPHQHLVLRRLHPTFLAEVNTDIEVITERLASFGLETPRLVRASDGQASVTSRAGHVWRALTFIEGDTVAVDTDPSRFESAARVVARVHAALSGFDHRFAFERPGAHDTALHMERLRQRVASPHRRREELLPLAKDILTFERPHLGDLPRRIIHGDLKLTNILFFEGRSEARCLLDLDTFQWGTVAIEMGDALRSWCNPAGEDAAAPTLSVEIFTAAARGYFESADVTPAEALSLVPGFETIAIELASRFCLDAFEEKYFRADLQHFPSHSHHLEVRALCQLQLALEVKRRHRDLQDIVRQICRL